MGPRSRLMGESQRVDERPGRAVASVILDRCGWVRELRAPQVVGARPFGLPVENLRTGAGFADVCRESGLVASGDAVVRVVASDELSVSVTYSVEGVDGRRWW